MQKSDYFILVLVVATLIVGFFLLAPSSSQISQLNEELHKKQEVKEELQAQTREVDRQIDQLHHDDPAVIESIARDKFGYCRPGEEIYQLEKPKADK